MNVRASRAAILDLIRCYQEDFKIREVLFALPKPQIPGGYGNPLPRLIFPGPGGQYRVKTVLDGKICEHTLTDGQLLCCLPKSCVLRLETEGETTVSIVFMKHCIRFVYKLEGGFYWYHSRHPLSNGGDLLFRGLLAFAREKRPQELLTSAASGLLGVIRDDFENDLSDTGKAQQTYRQALYLMRNQFQSDISRESIAAQLEITPPHLSRLFKNSGGGGFTDILTRLRLEYAIEQMYDSDLAQDEVAEMSGFRNCSYFIKVFRKYYGTTPARFCRNGKDVQHDRSTE
jgi:AraC-like DNA-binding protein